MAALEALPGVGHKTASVVLVQAFGLPALPVDTHIHRLAARWGLSDGSSVEKTERDLKKLYPPEVWARLHLAMIYFGREYCPARGHDLSACPICSWAASKKRIAEEARSGGGGPVSRKAIAQKGRARRTVAGRSAGKAAKPAKAGKRPAARKLRSKAPRRTR
jgi:endonuclease-3